MRVPLPSDMLFGVLLWPVRAAGAVFGALFVATQAVLYACVVGVVFVAAVTLPGILIGEICMIAVNAEHADEPLSPSSVVHAVCAVALRARVAEAEARTPSLLDYAGVVYQIIALVSAAPLCTRAYAGVNAWCARGLRVALGARARKSYAPVLAALSALTAGFVCALAFALVLSDERILVGAGSLLMLWGSVRAVTTVARLALPWIAPGAVRAVEKMSQRLLWPGSREKTE